jgi:sigma-B regulation protein RsbU (phosphoserine phosphatase)
MRFRTAIALAISLALALALAVTVGVVSQVLERAARRELGRALLRDHSGLQDMLGYRKSLHRAEGRVLADEPRLKAVISTEDVTPATLVGVVADLRRVLRCDLMLLTDRRGRLLADTAHPEDSGAPLGGVPAIQKTLVDGEADTVWIDGTQVFQVHARRLSYGTMSVGAVVLGYRIDDALAVALSRHLDAGVVVLLDGQVVAASSLPGEVQLGREELAAVLSPLQGSSGARELKVHGVRYLGSAAPLPDYGGEQSLRYVLVRSLDSALAPARGLVHILYGITAVAIALALLAAVWLARRLARPLDELVTFTQRIAGGDLSPTTVTGLREARTLGTAMNQMVTELAASRTQIAEKTRLAKELEIAERIQMSILPRELAVPGLSLCAQMVPATEVGGDYYDVFPLADGCWLGVGDVAGHGLPAGLVMLMVQSAFAALVRARPTASPAEIVVLLNHIVFDNVRNRLGSDEHVTFTAARYYTDGRLVFAGAHESIVVLRAATGSCELVATPGTWLGVIDDVSHATVDTTLQLSVGDVAVLYSDGVTEAVNPDKGQLGIDRLCQELKACADQPASQIHHHLMSVVRKWSEMPDDDVTVLVLRYEGEHAQRA